MSAKLPINDTPLESPTSGQSPTRFSTPVSELDDHRHQTSPRPQAEMNNPENSHQHASDARAHHDHPTPHTLSPDVHRGNTQSAEPATTSRDFEYAIIDDDKSAHEGHLIEHPASRSPNLQTRGTLRRSRNPHPPPQLHRSRESSPSSRSSSPANSVDAFADGRRRERANTVGSRAPSEIIESGLHRSISGGTHHRRPTFNDGSVRDVNVEDGPMRNAAEVDICFPDDDEPTKTSKIDFEELDEFVTKHRLQSVSQPFVRRQRLSFSSPGYLPPPALPDVPKIVTDASTPSLKPVSDGTIDDTNTVLNEKIDSNDTAVAGDRKTQHGAPSEPARYSFFSSELEQTIHAADFADLINPGEEFRDLFDLPEDSGVWWLDIHNPTEEELHVFQRAFGIHRLTTEDIMTQEAREKVELFNQYYFVCFRSFFQTLDEHHEDFMEPVNVYMVVFREGIITITFSPSPHSANVRKRIGKLRDYMALTADWICYAMIDDIVDAFGPPIHHTEIEADTIEDQVFVARTEDFATLLRQIGRCRKKVMSLMRLLGGKADVIKGFAKRCNEQYSVTPRGDIGLYLGDIQDHVVTMMSNLGHFEKMLSRSHSNYLAQLSVDHIAQGNRTNDNLSKITVLASILVPLNLICGLFGMNVNVPGKNADGLGWFFGIVGVIAAIVVLSLSVARRFRFI